MATDGSNVVVGLYDDTLSSIGFASFTTNSTYIGGGTGLRAGGRPYVAYGAGRFLSVWLEGSTDSVDVHEQFLGSNPFVAFSGMPPIQLRSLTWDGATFLLLWSRTSGGISAIEGQLLNQDAMPIGEVLPISSIGANATDCAATGSGLTNHLVVWMESSATTNEWHTRARSVTEGFISEPATLSEQPATSSNPLAINCGNGKALAVWDRATGPFAAYPCGGIPSSNAVFWLMLYGRLIASDGMPIGSEFQITKMRGNQTNPQLAFDGNRYLLVWADSRLDLCGNRPVCGTNGFAQLIGSDGLLQDVQFELQPYCSAYHASLGLSNQFVVAGGYPNFNENVTTVISSFRDVNLGVVGLRNLVPSTNDCWQVDVIGKVVEGYGPPFGGAFFLQVSTNLDNRRFLWTSNCDPIHQFSALLVPNETIHWPDPFSDHTGPRFFRGANTRELCKANLRQLDTAKAAWAFEAKKTYSESPTDSDLFGPNSYLQRKPTCPAGGSYFIYDLQTRAQCSLATIGHTL